MLSCSRKALTFNVPVVYMGRDEMILMWDISISRAIERGGPALKIETFLGLTLAERCWFQSFRLPVQTIQVYYHGSNEPTPGPSWSMVGQYL